MSNSLQEFASSPKYMYEGGVDGKETAFLYLSMVTRVKASPPPWFMPNSSFHHLFQTTIEGGQYHDAVNVRADQVVPSEKPPKGRVLIVMILVINYYVTTCVCICSSQEEEKACPAEWRCV